jgi:hypothetical protein
MDLYSVNYWVFSLGSGRAMDDFSLLNSADGARRGPGRPQNTVKTEQLTLSLPPAQRELLEELTLTGYFGRNAVETATLLLWQALQECAPQRLQQVREFRAQQESQQASKMKAKLQKLTAILNDE